MVVCFGASYHIIDWWVVVIHLINEILSIFSTSITFRVMFQYNFTTCFPWEAYPVGKFDRWRILSRQGAAFTTRWLNWKAVVGQWWYFSEKSVKLLAHIRLFWKSNEGHKQYLHKNILVDTLDFMYLGENIFIFSWVLLCLCAFSSLHNTNTFLHALSFLATKLNIVKIIYLNTHFKRIPLNACVNDMIEVKMLAINTTMTYSYEVHLSYILMEYDRKLAQCNIQSYELDMKNNKMLNENQNRNRFIFDALW